jgi:hypothetical protein
MSKKNPASLPVLFAFALGITWLSPSASQASKKERFTESGKLVEMQDVPCGSQERGLMGLGAVVASAGVTSVNSKDKLCQEYVLRTAEAEYRIRPVDDKHPGLLPVGSESEFRIKKDRLLLSVPEGDGKVREYKVVAVKPLNGADSEAPASASGTPLRQDAQPAAGRWTATLDKNSPAGGNGNPVGSNPADANLRADHANAAASDPAVADSDPGAPNSTQSQQFPDAATPYRRGTELEQKGDINGAVSEFRKAIEAKPDDPRAHAALAGALERRGDSQGALKEYGLALKLDPDDPAIRANYDRLVQTRGGDSSGAGS